jgi:co-chaperonin GroES (HSP10)
MATKISETSMESAFPAADPGVQPFGRRVLGQIRNPKQKTTGGIIIDLGSQETEKWNTQVAKVISVGPLAFKNRDTMQPWPEGDWCKAGDFVRVPKYGGDRWEVDLDDKGVALFVIFNDLDIVGRVTTDPTKIRAFI